MLDQLHETESQLCTALPHDATAAQRTMRMPAAPVSAEAGTGETVAFARPAAQRGADAETAIIAPRGQRPAEISDSTSALARVSQKRRGRGLAIFLVILVLAAAAGVTGWYFGLGPGSQVTIPDVAGMSTADATTAITKLGLRVNPTPGQAFSTTVASGQVANTDPKIGTPVAHGGTVQLLISQGPQPFPLPTLIGQSEKDATDLVSTHWKLGTVFRQFDPKVASGIVLDALDGAGKSLKGIAQYGDQQKVSLVVSAGPLPSDLAGKSVDDAKAELAAAPYGLTVTGTVDVFSQSVPKGAVVGLVTTDSAGNAIAIRVGDKVQLQTSKGPEQVQVPNVIGMDWPTAKRTLTDAGFQIAFKDHNSQILATLNGSTVKSIDPGVGKTVDKGSTVTVSLKLN